MNAIIQETAAEGCCRPSLSYCDFSVFLPESFTLESGERLSRPELRVRVHGDLAKPAIAVAGGVSSSRVVADVEHETGWWREMVRPGGAVDTDRFAVISFDFLPNAHETARTITTLDQARALAHALDVLKVDGLSAFVGASYGGMIALAFAAAFPSRAERLCVISASERPHPAATALRGVQRRIVEFAARCGDAGEGVSLARQLAMVAYRSPEEFAARFDHRPGAAAGDPYAVCDYLIARGEAFAMAPQRYVTLSDSVDRHDADISKIKAPALLIAATTDRLVPLEDIRRVKARLPAASLVEIPSLYGHDAFLKDASVIGPNIRKFLEERVS